MTGPFTIPLNESEPVVLDGTGAATVQMRPDGSRERWAPSTAHVKVTTAGAANPPEATCVIYAGNAPTAANFVDTTFTGSSGDSTDRVAGRIIGRTADAYLWAVWSGGEPGAVATLTVVGTKSLS